MYLGLSWAGSLQKLHLQKSSELPTGTRCLTKTSYHY